MKKILFLSLAFVLWNCSSDDNNAQPDSIINNASYSPQQIGNYWTYNVLSDVVGKDSLYISSSTVHEGEDLYNYTAQIPTYGYYSNLMNGSSIRSTETALFINGNMSLGDVFGNNVPMNIDFNNFKFFDSNATNGTILDNKNGYYEIPYQDNGILKVTYNLTTEAGENLATYTQGGNTYSDVKQSKIRLNVKVVATIVVNVLGVPTSFDYTLLNSQDVLISIQYYAKGIGMVFANTDFQYSIDELPAGFNLPIPQNYSSNTKESLASYKVE
ncbi:MAG: hypothetical protein Q4B43_03200 [Bacteroidota bacterium]|nr:hypothetical protein [Bacteroidota bacterium]